MFEYYRDLSIKKIFTKKFTHLLFLLFWPAYLTVFVLTEKYVVPRFDIHSPIDDYIPFCEFFVIPYVAWYGLLAFVSLYTLFFDKPTFKKLYKFLCVAAFLGFCAHILFPTMQSLRPQEFARDNIFVDLVKILYSADTNTNVCPSFHVIFSVGLMFALWNTRYFRSSTWRIVNVLITASICVSTVFLKQHSIIDVFAGVGLSAIILPFTFYDFKCKNIF